MDKGLYPANIKLFGACYGFGLSTQGLLSVILELISIDQSGLELRDAPSSD